jgi:ABC-type dipeptide/oligopeptide/nickel transport system permease component
VHVANPSRPIRVLTWVVGTIGVSLPSFFWAMLLQLFVVAWFLMTRHALLPTFGYGFDEHAILPTFALAARPMAYVFRTTATALDDAARSEYVVTARAKGVRERAVLLRHILPNARTTYLAGVAYGARGVLSSLAIVEYLFSWTGAGLGFVSAVAIGNVPLAAGLAAALAGLFAALDLAVGLSGRDQAALRAPG